MLGSYLTLSRMAASQMAASDSSLCKTPLGETGCLGNPYFIHRLPKHPVFLFTLTPYTASQANYGYLPLTVQPCVTYRTLCHAIGHQLLPTLAATLPLYLGKKRISLRVAISLSMYLCPHIQLDCNQFTIILGLYLYLSKLQKFCLW